MRDGEGKDLPLVVEPRNGRVVLFHNCEDDGAGGGKADGEDEDLEDDCGDLESAGGGGDCYRPHPSTRHAGMVSFV